MYILNNVIFIIIARKNQVDPFQIPHVSIPFDEVENLILFLFVY